MTFGPVVLHLKQSLPGNAWAGAFFPQAFLSLQPRECFKYGNVGLSRSSLLLEEEACGTFPQLFAKQGRGLAVPNRARGVPEVHLG